MSCSEQTLRARADRFFASPYYILAVMALSVIAHTFSLEIPVFTAYALVAVYTALWGEDLLPVTPLLLFCYISVSIDNNPGRNPSAIFYGKTGVYLAVLGGTLALALAFRVIRDRKQFFEKKLSLLPGLLLLAVSYFLSGVGSEKYEKVLWDNLLFALMQSACLLLPYWLLSCGVRWEKARKDYCAWIGFTGGAAVLVQVLVCYMTRGVIEDGIIIRERVYTGWGMYNNMGFLLAMAIPFAFYLATRYHRGWIGTVVGSVFLVGVLLTCSRTSLLIGTAVYCLCVFWMLFYARNRRHNTIALVVVIVVSALALLLFRDQLLRLFSRFLGMGMDPSSRDVFFREGWKLFLKAPVLGNSFYSPGYVPWDFSNVDALSALIPPRWHSTPLQLLVSCGLFGVCAYIFHRYQTVRLLLKGHSKERTFFACAIGVVLLCSLFDCHFFNLGPGLMYSAILAFLERSPVKS